MIATDAKCGNDVQPVEDKKKDPDRTHLTFVFNWFDERKAKAPTPR